MSARRQPFRAVLLLSLPLLLVGLWLGGHPEDLPGFARTLFVSDHQSRVIEEAINRIARDYYRPVSKKRLADASVAGAVASLGDRFSHYLTPREYADFNQPPRFTGIGVQVAERRGQAVAAVLARRATERPQGVLQALGERHVALPAQDDVGVFEPRAHQPEVVQAVLEHDACHRDAQVAHLREVGQSHAAGFVRLPENHLSVLPVQRAPGPDAALERAANARGELRVTAPQLVEYRHRPNAGRGLQQRDDLGVEDVGERVGSAPLARRLLDRW